MSKPLCSHSHGSVHQHKHFLVPHFRKRVRAAVARQARRELCALGRRAGCQCWIQPCASPHTATAQLLPLGKSQWASKECQFTSYQAPFSKAKQNSTYICSSLPAISQPSLLCSHLSPSHTSDLRTLWLQHCLLCWYCPAPLRLSLSI